LSTDIITSIAATVGGGFFGGLLFGYAIKKVVKLIAVITGLFVAGLAYLQYQQIASIDWNRIETMAGAVLGNVTGHISTNQETLLLQNILPLPTSREKCLLRFFFYFQYALKNKRFFKYLNIGLKIATLRKPIFEKWYSGKPPTLQIGILRWIISYGQTSKKRGSYDLDANYSDISNAIEALKKRDFITLPYKKKSSRNPEKFYKITRNGLKALLSVDKLSPQEFWKAAVLLCITSEGNGYQSQFPDYYNRYENDFIGVSARRHLLPSWFFDDILRLWLEENNNELSAKNIRSAPPIPQIVIECLAFNGSMNLKQLVKKTGAKEEEIVKILNNYLIKPGDILDFSLQSQDKTDIRKKIYDDFSSHLLIYANDSKTGTTYELSIFGALLAIALIRCYHNSAAPSINSFERGVLINRYDKMEECYEKIAFNHREKLPLIFGKWSLLRSQLGPLLYYSFDFLIIEKAGSNIRDTSVWFGGNKEFYEEVQSMAQNTHVYKKMIAIHDIGKDILQKYQQYEYKLLPIRKKITEIEGELFVTQVLSSFGKKVTDILQHLEVSEDTIKKIEEIFVEEVSFFFIST
jgi:uncharacterized membrane protein (Fun14 family)